MNDLDIAMMEIYETEDDLVNIELSERFKAEIYRIREDLNISAYVNLTDDMIKWVLLADRRSKL